MSFFISTFNTCLVQKDSRKLELGTRTSKFQIDVICIQEHQIIQKNEIGKESLYQNILLTCSSTKNSPSAAIGGVGFLLPRRAMNSLINMEKINERIAILTVEVNPRTTIINCYNSTNISSETEIENFYQSTKTPSHKFHNMVIVGRDFKAKMRHPEMLHSFNLPTNHNGQMIWDLMVQHGLIALNTRFRKSEKKLWTFVLDYILCRKKWRNCFKNCQSYNSFDTIGSNHRIVSCKFNISYR